MHRKITRFVLLSLVVLVTACSEDQAVAIPVADNPKLLKKTDQILYADDSGSITNTMDYNYVNGRLESVTENGWLKSEFTYDGPKVMQASVYQSGNFKEHVNFVYVGDQLSYTLADGDNNPVKMEFFYKNGILVGLVRSYLLNNETFVPFVSKEFTFLDRNVTEYASTWDEVSATFNVIYSYDDKHNQALNMNPYLRMYLASDNPDGLSGNNFLEATLSNPDNVQTHYTYQTVYEDDYPVDIKQYMDDGTLVMHMTLEYY